MGGISAGVVGGVLTGVLSLIVLGGPVTAALMKHGIGPIRAGLVTATAMELGADQGMNTARKLTASPGDFPLVTHARAVAAHAVYGLALGLTLAAGGTDAH